MADLNSHTPIIKKKKKHHDGHHGGAWKVAYADFVTAMMALFIVLWVLGQDDAMKKAVAHYFKNPIGFSSGGNSMLKGGAPSIIALKDEGQIKPEFEKEQLRKMGDKMITELSKDPDFTNLMEHLKIEIVDEGLRIELLDSKDDVFFEIGTAALKEPVKKILRKITLQLTKINNLITIEGHTDSRPYSGSQNGYTNFELSADRANSARREIVLAGLDEKRIVDIRGFADRRLRDVNDPYSVSNRRISIIVKFTSPGK